MTRPNLTGLLTAAEARALADRSAHAAAVREEASRQVRQVLSQVEQAAAGGDRVLHVHRELEGSAVLAQVVDALRELGYEVSSHDGRDGAVLHTVAW